MKKDANGTAPFASFFVTQRPLRETRLKAHPRLLDILLDLVLAGPNLLV